MFSYSYKPSAAFASAPLGARPSAATPTVSGVARQAEKDLRSENEGVDGAAVGPSRAAPGIYETLASDEVVTLDCLTGVVRSERGCTFVQYIPTEEHKLRAGRKSAPVEQINRFLRSLGDSGVPAETSLIALCPLEPGRRKTLWIRVALEEVQELSLEALWMLKGEARLHAERTSLVVWLESSALGSSSLSPTAERTLCPASERDAERLAALAEEGLLSPCERGERREEGSSREAARVSTQRDESGPGRSGLKRVRVRTGLVGDCPTHSLPENSRDGQPCRRSKRQIRRRAQSSGVGFIRKRIKATKTAEKRVEAESTFARFGRENSTISPEETSSLPPPPPPQPPVCPHDPVPRHGTVKAPTRKAQDRAERELGALSLSSRRVERQPRALGGESPPCSVPSFGQARETSLSPSGERVRVSSSHQRPVPTAVSAEASRGCGLM